MRKVITFLCAALCIAAGTMAQAQQAPDMFRDVDPSHWAYDAVKSLQAKGILIGYPDGTFKGRRTLTRYEFAVALDRALKSIGVIQGPQGEQGPEGPQGPQGDVGPAGPEGPAGVTPEELATFRRLADEFKNELASLGDNVNAIDRRLDDLSKRVSNIQEEINKMPKIYGHAFMGFRNDSGTIHGVDADGLTFAPNVVVEDLALGVHAQLGNGATLTGEMITGNYKGYETTGVSATGAIANDTYLQKLEFNAPLKMVGRDSSLTIGRFGEKISSLTFEKPNFDTYLSDPDLNDGKYYMDGARVNTNFGSLNVNLVAGQTTNVTGQIINPTAGMTGTMASNLLQIAGGKGIKPAGIMPGAITVDKVVGLNMGVNVPVMHGIHLRGTVMDLSGNSNDPSMATYAGGDNVYVYGSGLDMKLSDRVTLQGEWAASVLGAGRFSTRVDHLDNAYNADLGYKSGALNVNAGYRYIDPLFYAPGYWGKLGNWYNPTNIQGPTFNAAYDFTPRLGVNVGGAYYTGARNLPGNLGTNDSIYQVLAGVHFNPTKNLVTTLGYEGVFWNFGGGDAFGIPSGSSVTPTEQYFRIGAGMNLTSSTMLKLGYELGMFNGHNLVSDYTSGLNSANYNTFTSSVIVKY